METESTEPNERTIKNSRWIFWGIGGIAVAAAAVIWFARRSGHFIVGTVNYVVESFSNGSGLSPDLVRGLIILFTIPFFWAVAKYVHSVFFFHLRPSLRLYTNRYGLIIVAYVAAFFLARYGVRRGQLYNKWCAETPEGVRAYDQPGKDPVYGIKLTPCTPDQITVLRATVEAAIPTPHQIDIYRAGSVPFFDSRSGRPIVWFYRTADGYDLFDAPGFHPLFREPLKPVSGEVAGRINEWINAQRKARPPSRAPEKIAPTRPILRTSPVAAAAPPRNPAQETSEDAVKEPVAPSVEAGGFEFSRFTCSRTGGGLRCAFIATNLTADPLFLRLWYDCQPLFGIKSYATDSSGSQVYANAVSLGAQSARVGVVAMNPSQTMPAGVPLKGSVSFGSEASSLTDLPITISLVYGGSFGCGSVLIKNVPIRGR